MSLYFYIYTCLFQHFLSLLLGRDVSHLADQHAEQCTRVLTPLIRQLAEATRCPLVAVDQSSGQLRSREHPICAHLDELQQPEAEHKNVANLDRTRHTTDINKKDPTIHTRHTCKHTTHKRHQQEKSKTYTQPKHANTQHTRHTTNCWSAHRYLQAQYNRKKMVPCLCMKFMAFARRRLHSQGQEHNTRD